MLNLLSRIRPKHRSESRPSFNPTLESLEGRILLYSATGNKFAHTNLITWSIVPDGTYLGGVRSNLVSVMNQKLGNTWVPAIQDAFARWENVANVNFAQVGDDGENLGDGPLQQGNGNFGDIRISGFAQGNNILAFTLLPPPANGDSSAGDIFLNSAQTFKINNTYDLESVVEHEVGHALGLGHSADQSAVMYSYYTSINQTPATDDVNGLQSIVGDRPEDAIAIGNSNFVSSKAANLTPYITASNNQVVCNPLAIANPNEMYWFKVTTPANASPNLTVGVQTSGLSMLSAKVTLYDSAVRGLQMNQMPANQYGGYVNVSINNATPNTTYYIRVSGTPGAIANGSGAYALLVNMGSGNLVPVPSPNTITFNQPNQGGGSSNQEVDGHHDEDGDGDHDEPQLIFAGNGMHLGDFLTVAEMSQSKTPTLPTSPTLGLLIPNELAPPPIVPPKPSRAGQVGLAYPTGPALVRRA